MILFFYITAGCIYLVLSEWKNNAKKEDAEKFYNDTMLWISNIILHMVKKAGERKVKKING